ncbi:MAG: alpha/beta fold hydrolase [Acidimicrobiales bacterium]
MSSALEHHFAVDGITLAGHLARPSTSGDHRPGVVVCHGYPSGHGSGPKSAHTYPQMADRIAEDIDAVVLAFNFRGCRPSLGMFSMAGWRNDLRAAIGQVAGQDGVDGVAVVGFGTGGALALSVAASDPRVRAIATLGAPADFTGWLADPKQLLNRSRELGILGGREPEDLTRWAEGLRDVRPVAGAEAVAPRPLLVMHGADDDLAPQIDARVLADAHGSAELKIISGAGHQLRHDPRAVALLLGWLDRQRAAIRGEPWT